ncbi:uncharacterized protein F4807DRAFT_465155 [Annulohypoxylon truncatum]|uniref:uncharacterized protein n=1 Tax=Annulohypoxylon truncatum TaxID=327061 RepID=UPI002008625C|nr:uncharacterized protein F4807DRAFT_465155 [Annulohypoxylon truncatum]KAI1204919.1 hypothetical protein F4807DRAFT_465155 [Annulohypoxylon truncatum]
MDSSTSPSEPTHDEKSKTLIIVICIVCTVATIAVGLRFYTRLRLLKQLGVDDYLIFVAWAFTLGTGISQCMNTRNGLGKHVWDLDSAGEVTKYLKGFYVSIALYNCGLLFVKLGFLTQYYRVFSLKNMRRTFIVAMIIIGCWSLSQVIVGIFNCRPIDGFWEKTADSKCISHYPQWYINAAGNIMTDIVILVLPLPVLRHLHMPRAQRVVLIGIFSLGFFTCAISVVRVKFLKLGGDFTYANVQGSSWSIVELCSGVTCACLPTLRPLISKWIPSLSNRLHKPVGTYKRHSDACRTTMQRASRHIRLSSTASNQLNTKSKEKLFYRDDIEAHASDGADGLDGITDMRENRGSVSGHEHISPTPPARAHIASQRPAAYYSWMESSITTEIGADRNSQKLDSNANLSETVIQVRHDVVMQKI